MPPTRTLDPMNNTPPCSDKFARWLEAARAGSHEDLGYALEGVKGYLLLMAEEELGSTLRAKAGASDLVQESLKDAVQAFPGFRGSTREEFTAWAIQILQNNIADLARRYRGTGRRQVSLESPQSDDSPIDGVSDQLPGPFLQVQYSEEAESLRLAIAKLPLEAQQVPTWREFDQLGWHEIGARLGKSAEAARKIWFRSVERLRIEMGVGRDRSHSD